MFVGECVCEWVCECNRGWISVSCLLLVISYECVGFLHVCVCMCMCVCESVDAIEDGLVLVVCC